MKPILISLFFFFTTPLFALTCTWTGSSGNGLWNDPGNWDCSAIPAVTDDVIISSAETISLENDVILNNFTFNNATLIGSANLTTNGTLRLSSGQIQLEGDITTNGLFDFRGGNLSGSGVVNCNSTVDFRGQGKNIGNRTMNLLSAASWTSGAIFMQGDAQIVVSTGQNWDVSVSSFILFNNGSNNKLIVDGTMTVTSGGLPQIRVPVEVNGTLVCSADLQLTGGGVFNNSLVNIASGERLRLVSATYSFDNSDISGLGSFEVSGTVNFNSGILATNLTIRGTFTYDVAITPLSLVISGGNLAANFPLIIPGDLVWNGGTISGPENITVDGSTSIGGNNKSNVLESCYLTLNGNVNYLSSARQISLKNSATLEIGNSSIFTKSNNLTIFNEGNNNLLINNGTMELEGDTDFQIPISNPGTINAAANVVVTFFGGGNFNSGVINKDDLASISFASLDYSFDGMTYNSSADLFLTGGLLANGNNNFSFPFDMNNFSSIKGNGVANFDGGYSFAGTISPGNSPGILTINPDLTMTTSSPSTEIEVFDNSGPGSGHDQVLSQGSINLEGSLTVTEMGVVEDGSFTILSCSGGPNCLSGVFSSVNLPEVVGSNYSIQYNPTSVTLIRGTALAVDLTSFTGRAYTRYNQLKWSTAFEKNHTGFFVERSYDGVHFKTIEYIKGMGDRHTTTYYEFKDYDLFNTIQYYRIKDLDSNGEATYSKVISLDNKNGKRSFLESNLVQRGDDIEFLSTLDKNATFELYNLAGALLKRKEVDNFSVQNAFSSSNLNAGAYILSMRIEERSYIERLVIVD